MGPGRLSVWFHPLCLRDVPPQQDHRLGSHVGVQDMDAEEASGSQERVETKAMDHFVLIRYTGGLNLILFVLNKMLIHKVIII